MPPFDSFELNQLDSRIRSNQIEIEELKMRLEQQIREHQHDGNQTTQVNDFDILGPIPARISTESVTIATTGNTDVYIIVPISGQLKEVDFSGTDALAANDTNYITFSITNLGRDGASTTAMLLATDTNTTKATGGSAISANTVRELTLSNTLNNNTVVAGERLRIRAAATGTLANTVTNSIYMLRFK